MPREVGARQIVKHQFRLEVEQVAQAVVQRHLDPALVQQEMIQRAIPGLQLRRSISHAPLPLPARHIAPSRDDRKRNRVSSQAPKACSLPGRVSRLAINASTRLGQSSSGFSSGNNRGQRRPASKHLPQAQLREEVPDHEHRSPRAGVQDFDRSLVGQLLGKLFLVIVAAKKAFQQRQDGFQGIAPPEVGDDLLFDASLLPHGSDNADVFVNDAGGTTNLDGADEHDAVLASPFIAACQADHRNLLRYMETLGYCLLRYCHYAFSENGHSDPGKPGKTRASARNPTRHLLNMG